MANLNFTGAIKHRVLSFITLNRIALSVFARHALGRKMAEDWDAMTEIGIRFWRHQFTRAMTHPQIRVGREIYKSLQPLPDVAYPVTTRDQDTPKGSWIVPQTLKTQMTLLYFHGGGYTFDGPVSDHFGKVLAHHVGARVFMPSYRLTPEHPHPAQSEDAMTAWGYLRKSIDAERLVIIGDSAGGHMALTLLNQLRDQNEPQPALCVGLCPWTDIGNRGASLQTNDRYDLVQGWMALRFGEWLDPDGRYGRAALSPIHWNFSGLAPVYLQAGGRENLRDMIVDFAQMQSDNGASVMLDQWDDMMHNFQIADTLHASSGEALARIAAVIRAAGGAEVLLPSLPNVTRVASGRFETALLPDLEDAVLS
ncbi:MAG: alpha/beta hydrolase [Sulfitobacter sp.]